MRGKIREILFRGKRLDNGEWVYGDLLRKLDYMGNIITKIAVSSGYDGYCVYDVGHKTVCQYTGRYCYSDKDDDLHKIFEGDIFDVTTFDHNGHDYHHICKVEWVDGGFALVSEKEDFFMWIGEVEDTESDFLLLGNIFDNPDLLTTSSTDSD